MFIASRTYVHRRLNLCSLAHEPMFVLPRGFRASPLPTHRGPRPTISPSGKYPKLEGGAFFSIDCIENYELIRELSSFGKDLLVLSPADIQQKVRDRVAAQFQAYQAL